MAKEDTLSKEERSEVKKEIQKARHKQLFEQAKKKSALFKQEFKTQTAAAIIAAFGFLIALVWKDIIVQAVDKVTKVVPSVKYAIVATILSAVIVTLVCVLGIVLINRWAKGPEK